MKTVLKSSSGYLFQFCHICNICSVCSKAATAGCGVATPVAASPDTTHPPQKTSSMEVLSRWHLENRHYWQARGQASVQSPSPKSLKREIGLLAVTKISRAKGAKLTLILSQVAYSDSLKASSTTYSTLYICLPCPPGCDTCSDDTPCLAEYNLAFRWQLLFPKPNNLSAVVCMLAWQWNWSR